MLEFDAVWAFLLLPLPLLMLWLVPPHRESRDSLQVPYFQRLVTLSGEAPRSASGIRRRLCLQAIATSLGWLFLVSALARPQWLGEPVHLEKSARDLMLALDLSGSMEATDFQNANGEQIDRLTVAKDVLRDFAAQREGDRLGLIVFGSAAYLQAPFTDDHQAWQSLLEESIVNMAGPSTALGDAIGLSISQFRQSKTENRVLILLTDGNDTGSKVPPLDAAQVALTEGITIYTVAVGDPSTVGEEALDLETLDAIASDSGGLSFTAIDRDALQDTYERIDQLEPAAYDSLSYRPRQSMFHVPLAAFALLYVLATPLFLLISTRKRRLEDV